MLPSFFYQVHDIIAVFWMCGVFAMGLINNYAIAKLGPVIVFFRLKRLLKAQCVAVAGDLIVIVVGRCCVGGKRSTPL